MSAKRFFSIDKAFDWIAPYLDVTFGLGDWDIQFDIRPDQIDGYVNFIHDYADISILDCITLSAFKKKALKAIREFEVEQERRMLADKKVEELFNPDQYNPPWPKGVMRTLHDCKETGCPKECK